MISIVIPTYNHASSLPKCLDSLFSQTYKDIEVIVVNDGSTDNTNEVVKPYLDRIKYIEQENRGSNPARNRGVAEALGRSPAGEASGEYLLFCDADITLQPDALSKLLHALEQNPEVSYVYCSFIFGNKKFPCQPFDADELRKNNYINTMALICREHFPGFDEEIWRFQDWDLWLTMLEAGHTGILVPEYLMHATIERQGISTMIPSFMHRIPWHWIGWKPRSIREHDKAKRIVMEKHGLV